MRDELELLWRSKSSPSVDNCKTKVVWTPLGLVWS